MWCKESSSPGQLKSWSQFLWFLYCFVSSLALKQFQTQTMWEFCLVGRLWPFTGLLEAKMISSHQRGKKSFSCCVFAVASLRVGEISNLIHMDVTHATVQIIMSVADIDPKFDITLISFKISFGWQHSFWELDSFSRWTITLNGLLIIKKKKGR